MYLTAMTHREELFDLTLRWMNDDFNPGDGKKLTRIFVYESAISAVAVDSIVNFLGRLSKSSLHMERIHQKQVLRERIIAYRQAGNPRMDELADNFFQNPDLFFPHMPVDAAIISDGDCGLVAIARIKRLSRVAEKVSFRLVDALFREIQIEALHISTQRVSGTGVPPKKMLSSSKAMQKDFIKAEAAVAHRFHDKNVSIDRGALTINDIIGFKIIGQPEMFERLPQVLNDEPGITVVEIEKHNGDYNAVNLLLDIDLPSPETLTAYMLGINWSMALRQGLDPDDVRRNVSSYVRQGAATVRIEIILTTYEELIESEFGRSIHELRLLRLRQRQAYSGLLGKNAEYLIEYMLALASSPTVSISKIPFKMYGRYLPESIAALKCALQGNDISGDLLSTFCLQQDCLSQFCKAGSVLS